MKKILETLAGSKLYGTSTPESDTDVRGIVMQPIKDLINPFQRFEQEVKSDEDTTFWSLDKFFHLADAGNPNILETLYANEKSIISVTKEGLRVLENAELFLSLKVRQTFIGYAFA